MVEITIYYEIIFKKNPAKTSKEFCKCLIRMYTRNKTLRDEFL